MCIRDSLLLPTLDVDHLLLMELDVGNTLSWLSLLSLHCELSVLGKSMVGQQTWREPEFACKRNMFDSAMESDGNFKEYYWNFPRIRNTAVPA